MAGNQEEPADSFSAERKSVLKYLSYTRTVQGALPRIHHFAVDLAAKYPQESHRLFLLGEMNAVLAGLLHNLMTPEQFSSQVWTAPLKNLSYLDRYKPEDRDNFLAELLPSTEDMKGQTLVIIQLLHDSVSTRNLTPAIARVLRQKGINYQFEFLAGSPDELLQKLETSSAESGIPLTIHYHREYEDALENTEYFLYVGLLNPYRAYDLKAVDITSMGGWSPNPAFQVLTEKLRELESSFASGSP